MYKLTLLPFLLVITVLGLIASCRTGESQVIVIPGKSIAGVELGMHRKEVVSILGEPSKVLSHEDYGKTIQPGILGGEKFEGAIPQLTILQYSKPNVVVVLDDENDAVTSIQLGYTRNVHVEGYDFLKFNYLSIDELSRLGEPSSKTRDKSSEEYLLKYAPEGESIEYYVYDYERNY